MGRPTLYTREISDEICARMEKGESLGSICRSENMPARPTVILWANEDRDGFSDRYARARNVGLDFMAEQLIDIADDSSDDIRFDGEGNEYIAHDHINRSRLRVDARKWYLSKLAPKRYGEKLTAELTGAEGGPVIVKIVD